jgi:hypothetical protein
MLCGSGAAYPEQLRTPEAIAEYLNALTVETCAIETGMSGAREWKITVARPESVLGKTVDYGAVPRDPGRRWGWIGGRSSGARRGGSSASTRRAPRSSPSRSCTSTQTRAEDPDELRLQPTDTVAVSK